MRIRGPVGKSIGQTARPVGLISCRQAAPRPTPRALSNPASALPPVNFQTQPAIPYPRPCVLPHASWVSANPRASGLPLA